MNRLQNKVQLIGRLGADPIIRKTKDGKPVANFSIATNERRKDKNGEPVETTSWHRVVAWQRLAEFSERYLKKGKQIALEGKIRYDEYTDKDGVTKYTTDIIASDIALLGKKDDVNVESPAAN